jgi:sporulation protein YlmC with PRC-barrel domain
LAKSQKEKSVTKDRLVGMTVIDSEGNIVGTVKDVGFTVGRAGISLSVEDKEGDIRDVAWDSIQGAGDFVLLKPSAAQPSFAAQPVQAAQQAAQPSQPLCPTCGRPLTFVQQYQRWYCYNDKKYV